MANGLEILRGLSREVCRRPTEDELVEKLSKNVDFELMEEDDLRRWARRTITEGRKRDNILKREAKEKLGEARERRSLDKGRDEADPEDALHNPEYMGAYGLGKQRTIKIGWTR